MNTKSLRVAVTAASVLFFSFSTQAGLLHDYIANSDMDDLSDYIETYRPSLEEFTQPDEYGDTPLELAKATEDEAILFVVQEAISFLTLQRVANFSIGFEPFLHTLVSKQNITGLRFYMTYYTHLTYDEFMQPICDGQDVVSIARRTENEELIEFITQTADWLRVNRYEDTLSLDEVSDGESEQANGSGIAVPELPKAQAPAKSCAKTPKVLNKDRSDVFIPFNKENTGSATSSEGGSITRFLEAGNLAKSRTVEKPPVKGLRKLGPDVVVVLSPRSEELESVQPGSPLNFPFVMDDENFSQFLSPRLNQSK